ALGRNTPMYYDSGALVSRTLAVANPAIPSSTLIPASDAVVSTPMRPVATDTARMRPLPAVSRDRAVVGTGPGFLPPASPRPAAAETARMRLLLAASPARTFGRTGSGFLPLAPPRPAAAGFYRYRVEMLTTKPANLTTPKLKSLEIEYTVKPRTPRIDSIRIGSAPWASYNSSIVYSALPRKDSLHLVCSGFDADDNGMEFRLSLGGFPLKSASGDRRSAGDY